jgi:hypothetical protein
MGFVNHPSLTLMLRFIYEFSQDVPHKNSPDLMGNPSAVLFEVWVFYSEGVNQR